MVALHRSRVPVCPLERRRLPPPDDRERRDQQRWVIKSLAVAEERNPFVLKDEVLTFEIAEEYANSGIRELYGTYNAPGDGFIELTTDLIKLGRD